jgi:diadenosine tetraphosphate (Ap4A) HIT family hydrolase
VFHVHLHVFPRFVGDSFTIDTQWQMADPIEQTWTRSLVTSWMR